MTVYTYEVKVQSVSSSNKFFIDGYQQPSLALGHDITYRFDVSDSSNAGHVFQFSTTSDGTHGGGTALGSSDGYTTSGTAGSANAYVELDVTSSTASTLYYFCGSSGHTGMGGTAVTTSAEYVDTTGVALRKPILGNSDSWGHYINENLNTISGKLPQSFTFPTGTGTAYQVVSSDGSGGSTWANPTVAPTIISIKYSNQTSGTFAEISGQTATDISGGQLCQIIGSNFDSTNGGDSSNATVSIGGTSATSILVNSAKTEITLTPPAKSAGSYTLIVTNSNGLLASTTISYDADPAWVTGANADLGDFIDGSITGTNGPQIIASESGSNLTTGYKRVTSNTDNTVITTPIAGLTLGDNGYLTGTLDGTEGATNTFYAVAHDNEGQQSAIRQFHFVSYDYYGHGGNSQNLYTYSSIGYKAHVFTSSGTFTLLENASNVDMLIIAGGGGGGARFHGGGGGAGGVIILTALSLNEGTYTITVGLGGGGGPSGNSNGTIGGNSSVIQASGTGSFSYTATGGGPGAGYGQTTGLDGGSGGGHNGGETTNPQGGNATNASYGKDGSDYSGSGFHAGGGGGGAGTAGGARSSNDGSNYGTADGGEGISNVFKDGTSDDYGGGGAGATGHNSSGQTGTPVASHGGGIIGAQGTDGTGGGGGAGIGQGAGGDGGNGIVVIRYRT